LGGKKTLKKGYHETREGKLTRVKKGHNGLASLSRGIEAMGGVSLRKGTTSVTRVKVVRRLSIPRSDTR